MTIEQTLTDQERLANLSLDQLRELVGLVDYDATSDPFPITGWDALVWVVGNATQAAAYYQLVYGMELVAYAGPATGLRDHHSFVLESAAARFVLNGPVEPNSPLLARLTQHGDGISDIALEVPDVDRCIAHARKVGATIVEEPHDTSDESDKTLLEISRLLRNARLTQKNLQPEYKTDPSKPRTAMKTKLGYSPSKAKRLLNWEPQVDIERGIERLITWAEEAR